MITDERLIELALGSEAATAEESVEMAMMLLNWHEGPKEENTKESKGNSASSDHAKVSGLESQIRKSQSKEVV